MCRASVPILLAVLFVSAAAVAQISEPAPTVLMTWNAEDLQVPILTPSGVAVDRWGNVYATDQNDHCVWKFDANGGLLEKWGTLGSGPGEFSVPIDVDVDDAGYVYVLEAGNLRVQKLDPDGNHVLDWDTVTGAPGTFTFQQPRGLACTPSGEVYVTDQNYSSVFAFDSQGTPALHWGTPGGAPGQFLELRGLDVGPDGRVYVADQGSQSIEIFAGNGVFLQQMNSFVHDVLDVAVDLFGNVYCLDDGGSVLLKLDSAGLELSTLQAFRDGPGLAVFGYGTVLVADGHDRGMAKCGYPPVLAAIADVAADQGRWVRLTWTPTLHDRITLPSAITGYGVYRRIDGRVMEDWDFVATVPARGDTLYNLVAPTLCDSTDAGLCWSVFAVTAFTSYGEFFDSAPDSGYSIDNLPPGAPAMPSVTELSSLPALEVSWDANPAPDLDHYGVFRGDAPDFEPSDPRIPDFETFDLSIVDTDVSPGDIWYYRVAAYDDAGNVSGYSPAAGATVLTGAETPAALVLHRVTPNPFNPRTAITFALSNAAAVDLRVYDLTGRAVRVLAEGTPYGPGRHAIAWDGADDAGRALASGVYVVRLRAGAETRTTRAALVR